MKVSNQFRHYSLCSHIIFYNWLIFRNLSTFPFRDIGTIVFLKDNHELRVSTAGGPPSFIPDLSSGIHQQEVHTLRNHNQRILFVTPI
jgi:hypothetical protein